MKSSVIQTYDKRTNEGQLDDFFVIKKKLFSHHWITFRTYSEPFQSKYIFNIWKSIEKTNLFSLSFVCKLSPKHF